MILQCRTIEQKRAWYCIKQSSKATRQGKGVECGKADMYHSVSQKKHNSAGHKIPHDTGIKPKEAKLEVSDAGTTSDRDLWPTNLTIFEKWYIR